MQKLVNFCFSVLTFLPVLFGVIFMKINAKTNAEAFLPALEGFSYM